MQRIDLQMDALQKAYQTKQLTPRQLVAYIKQRIAQYTAKNIWLYVLSDEELEPYLAQLEVQSPITKALYGIPFAIKDNIDLCNVPTTAACAAFSYTPTRHAFVVQQLIDAGAIPIGKTNMDQFATGLVGTRSAKPCKNAFDDAYISGGSSSGSGVAVALGQVSFSLGTDTAGSGRVPAALNNIVGLKPSLGLLSTTGVVPACRSLDTVSIFALSAKDSQSVFNVAAAFDEQDAYARSNPFTNTARFSGINRQRIRVGIPYEEQLNFFGDEQVNQLFVQAKQHCQLLGYECIQIDFAPFLQAAQLLYEGPWVTERFIVAQKILLTQPETMDVTVRKIIAGGAQRSAEEYFKAAYQLRAYKAQADKIMNSVDTILTPTIGKQFSCDEISKEPIHCNSQLGYYTNFMNLLDFSALALPIGFSNKGIAAGISFFSSAFAEQFLLAVGRQWQQTLQLKLGALDITLYKTRDESWQDLRYVDIAVCGAHLTAGVLNWQLQERAAQLIEQTYTAKKYRLYCLEDGIRPGLMRDEDHGQAIEIEVWRMPMQLFGSFVALIPKPLGIGQLEIQDGRWVCGFICEAYALQGARDISAYGGWRQFQAAQK